MKKYIFLVKGIEDLTGAPRYVNNKCKLLKEQGWDVAVFWSYDVSPAQLEHLIPFDKKEYIIHELLFYPYWFTKRHRNKVVERIVSQIGQAEQIVIESNKLQLGAWGEMIAKRIYAKHISFVTDEHIRIQNKSTFDFFYAKLEKNEFFTINRAAVQYIFSKFTTIQHPEKYYWNASPGVKMVEYEFDEFDKLPEADYTICHFGRRKGYFPSMLQELRSFISQYPQKTFNLFFLGDLNNPEEIRRQLQMDNVCLVLYPKAVEVIPLQIFKKSDVVIATAGCASLAARNGGKVIAMDVNSNFPLGLLRYTTLDSNTNSGRYENHKTLSEWLQSLLIDKDVYYEMEIQNTPHQFDFQMQFVTTPDGQYYDTTKINEGITKNDRLWMLLIKMGLFRLVEQLYFVKRKKRKNE